MSFTHSITYTWSNGSASLSKALSATGESNIYIDQVAEANLGASTHNIALNVQVALLKSFYVVSDKAVTIRFNDVRYDNNSSSSSSNSSSSSSSSSRNSSSSSSSSSNSSSSSSSSSNSSSSSSNSSSSSSSSSTSSNSSSSTSSISQSHSSDSSSQDGIALEITLAANAPYQWISSSGLSCPFTDDFTEIQTLNTAAVSSSNNATVRFRFLLDTV